MKNDLTQEMVDEADRLLNESKLPNKDILFNKIHLPNNLKKSLARLSNFSIKV